MKLLRSVTNLSADILENKLGEKKEHGKDGKWLQMTTNDLKNRNRKYFFITNEKMMKVKRKIANWKAARRNYVQGTSFQRMHKNLEESLQYCEECYCYTVDDSWSYSTNADRQV